VGIVYKHRRAIAVTDQIEPSLGSFERSERREDAIRRTARRDGKSCSDQRVLDLETADQRQPELMALARVLDADSLGEPVDLGFD
jgi:hypothetical protein